MAGRDDEPGRHRLPQDEPEDEFAPMRRPPWELVVLLVLIIAVVGSWALFRAQDDSGTPTPPPVAEMPANGGTDEPPDDVEPLTVDAYQGEATRICDDAADLAPLFSAANPTFTELEAVVRLALSSSVDKTLRELGALEPPAELQSAHDRALAAGEKQAETLRMLAEDLRGAADQEKAGNLSEDDRASVIGTVTEAAASLDRRTLEANDAYRELGVAACVAPVGDEPLDSET